VSHFSHARNQLSQFVNGHHQYDEQTISNYWNRIKGSFSNKQAAIFTFDSAEVKFLSSLQESKPESFSGAYKYLVGSPNFNNIDSVTGALLGYEFRRTEYPKLKYRKLGETESFKGLINSFRTQISDAEHELSKHLSDATKEFDDYVLKIDSLKEEKETLFNNWHDNATDKFDELTLNMNDLEDTYKNKLQLEKPAEYWSELAEKHKEQAWKAFKALVVFIVLVVVMLGVILWNPPGEVLTSFFGEDKGVAIRWSIIFVTFISFMAFCIRSISKVMFSSFHLSRDCEERHTLTFFYLALSKDNEIPKEERILIMQSLFSRADTGLLKDDASPTMPNDFATKIFGGR